jgi:hypothetical protein
MFCNRNKKESKSCILIESNEEIYMLIKIKLYVLCEIKLQNILMFNYL